MKKPVVPLSNKKNHPIMIGGGYNAEMKAFELHILVGNFKTKEDVAQAAEAVSKLLEAEFGARMSGVQ